MYMVIKLVHKFNKHVVIKTVGYIHTHTHMFAFPSVDDHVRD